MLRRSAVDPQIKVKPQNTKRITQCLVGRGEEPPRCIVATRLLYDVGQIPSILSKKSLLGSLQACQRHVENVNLTCLQGHLFTLF
jgi:hypothetical protein